VGHTPYRSEEPKNPLLKLPPTAGFMHPMKAGFNKLIAHGVTGGVRSRLSGGSFT
jgi:hypothetical protein